MRHRESKFYMIRIDDLGRPEVVPYGLPEIQLKTINEPDLGEFIAESPKVILRAINAGCEPVSFLVEEGEASNYEFVEMISRYPEVPVYVSTADVLSGLIGYKLTRGALCRMKRKSLPCPPEILENARRIAVLEDVVNPTNMGAIFRNAAALGMDGVLITRASTDPFYRRAARVSMGTVFQVPWCYIDDVNEVKKYGFKTVALALRDNTVNIDDEVLTAENRLALVLGTEGEGLKEETIEKSDYTVKIPMYHDVDSLNVAAASAVAFYVLGRK